MVDEKTRGNKKVGTVGVISSESWHQFHAILASFLLQYSDYHTTTYILGRKV